MHGMHTAHLVSADRIYLLLRLGPGFAAFAALFRGLWRCVTKAFCCATAHRLRHPAGNDQTTTMTAPLQQLMHCVSSERMIALACGAG
jgi:hypothetical protein